MTVIRCAKLVNPGQPEQLNVRIAVHEGMVADVCAVPPDERRLIEPIVVLPQLINAHTHLEFSHITSPLKPTHPFPDWIRSVIRHRRESLANIAESIQTGVTESQTSGIRFVAEICTSNEAYQSLVQNTQLTGICFRELIGFSNDRIDEQIQLAADFLQQDFPQHLQPGLSPHAPYTVHPMLFESLIQLASQYQVPVAMHLAESLEERQMLQHRSGPMVEFLQSLQLWQDSTLGQIRNIMPYLEQLATLPQSFAIHANYLNRDEHEFLCQHSHIAIVYCPRTHDFFGHSSHDWSRLKAHGATVLLGTDSRASNPDLSVLSEARFVARQQNLPLADILPMVSTTAAPCFGLNPQDFIVQRDSPAMFTTIPLNDWHSFS